MYNAVFGQVKGSTALFTQVPRVSLPSHGALGVVNAASLDAAFHALISKEIKEINTQLCVVPLDIECAPGEWWSIRYVASLNYLVRSLVSLQEIGKLIRSESNQS